MPNDQYYSSTKIPSKRRAFEKKKKNVRIIDLPERREFNVSGKATSFRVLNHGSSDLEVSNEAIFQFPASARQRFLLEIVSFRSHWERTPVVRMPLEHFSTRVSPQSFISVFSTIYISKETYGPKFFPWIQEQKCWNLQNDTELVPFEFQWKERIKFLDSVRVTGWKRNRAAGIVIASAESRNPLNTLQRGWWRSYTRGLVKLCEN